MDVSDIVFDDTDDQEEASFLVFEENWPTVEMFLALATCWKIEGTQGLYLGLDYPSVEVVFNMQSIRRSKRLELFSGLQIMERAVLNIINKKTET